MSGLASKQQSLKIFEKLKTKPANKVRGAVCNAPWLVAGSLSPSGYNMKLLSFPAAHADFAHHTDLFRLRPEESNMDVRTSGHLPVP